MWNKVFTPRTNFSDLIERIDLIMIKKVLSIKCLAIFFLVVYWIKVAVKNRSSRSLSLLSQCSGVRILKKFKHFFFSCENFKNFTSFLTCKEKQFSKTFFKGMIFMCFFSVVSYICNIYELFRNTKDELPALIWFTFVFFSFLDFFLLFVFLS